MSHTCMWQLGMDPLTCLFHRWLPDPNVPKGIRRVPYGFSLQLRGLPWRLESFRLFDWLFRGWRRNCLFKRILIQPSRDPLRGFWFGVFHRWRRSLRFFRWTQFTLPFVEFIVWLGLDQFEFIGLRLFHCPIKKVVGEFSPGLTWGTLCFSDCFWRVVVFVEECHAFDGIHLVTLTQKYGKDSHGIGTNDPILIRDCILLWQKSRQEASNRTYRLVARWTF